MDLYGHISVGLTLLRVIWFFFHMICKPEIFKNKYSLKKHTHFFFMQVKGARLVISLLFEEHSIGTKIFPPHLGTFLSSNFSVFLFLLGFKT